MPGSVPCHPGCSCKKHLPRSLAPCPPGCSCHRHACKPGCTCSRHGCKPGCVTCAVHRPREKGTESPRWKAGSTNYITLHSRVYRARGKASEQQCAECRGQAAHWATIHGKDGTDPGHCQPMCVPCHKRYDKTAEERSDIARRSYANRRL